MSVRPATAADRDRLHELYAQFFAELPPQPYQSDTLEDELQEVDEYLARHVALVAEEDGGLVGLALARIKGRTEGYVSDLFVRDTARKRGVAKQLLRAVAEVLRERGADHVTLGVDVGNGPARAVYDRLGFRTHSLNLVVGLDDLVARAAAESGGDSFGSVHVQTDDRSAVERAVAQFVPRLGRSAGTSVSEPRNGWVAVYDELCDREPERLRRLARELSDRMGSVVLAIGLEEGALVRYVLLDRGRVADEYASLPEFHGRLPPGDVVALRANPTVAARLTGADPGRVRAAAPTGSAPGDLPPPRDVLQAVAAALGVEGADRGWIQSLQ